MEDFGCRAPTLWLSELIYVRATIMSYCLNPSCENPSSPENANQTCCQTCGCDLLLKGRYWGIKKLGEGGCAVTYEVYEVDDSVTDNGTRKVLKILHQHKKDPKTVELFDREASLLNRLQHQGIPRFKDYFVEEAGIYTLHCLVMEKIEGVDLEKWFKDRENQPITQEQAIEWLSQLTEIIDVLHQNDCIHRDIKPSNIMFKNDGQLVLIDFGAVREINHTKSAITDDKDLSKTQVGTPGYMPEEQNYGKAFLESDFYALGRTFLELLTGKLKSELDDNVDRYTGKLEWQKVAPQVSKPLADLIDDLMAPFAVQRPKTAKELQKRLRKVKREIWLDSLLPFPRKNWLIIIPISAIATTIIMGVRLTGILQSWELAAFDGMMRSRPAEPIDPRILVVELTQEDVGGTYPVKDLTLAKLIEKIAQHQPRVIGLDTHRYEARPPGRKEFIQQFQKNSNLLTVCVALDTTPNLRPPDEFTQKQLLEQMGYSDLIGDNWIDNYRRRQFLSYDPKFRESPRCITPYSLSLVLAKRFLQTEGKPLTTLPNGDWHHDQVILKPLDARTGGYQNLGGESNEILINYRANFKPAEKVTLTQVLAGIKPELVKNRIVLIGYTARVARDNFNTPLGEMAGVWIHAHMTSQIISAVIDQRPLLWTLPQWGDAIFVWIWSLAGGAIVWFGRSPQQLKWIGIFAVASGGVTAALYLICYGSLVIGGWMPLVPSVLSLFSSGVLVFYISSKNS